MKIVTLILILLTVISSSEDFNRQSVSISVIPIKSMYYYPDLGFEYFLTSNDALAIFTITGLINRVAYSRRLGAFHLAGSLGFAFKDLEYKNTTFFYALTLEHRIRIGGHIFTRTLIGAAHAEEAFEDMPFIPLLQIGFGYSF